MKTILPLSKKPVRYALSVLILLLVVTTGCVARREALRVNTTLVASSDSAKNVVEKLRQASQSEVEAHTQTRAAYRKLLGEYRMARTTQALQEIRSAHQQTATEVVEQLVQHLVDLQTKRAEADKNLDEKLKAAFQPLSEKILGYKTAAQRANEREQEFPNDVARHDARVKADSGYLAAVALKLDMELDARKSAISSLDEVHLAAVTRLQGIAKDHRQKLDQILAKGVASLVTDPNAKFDLGPEPEVNEAGFAGLVAYTETVRKAGESNRDYLVSNSFGAGSFFSDFFNTMGRGFLGGVFNPSSVKGINNDVVMASFKDFSGAVLGSVKENLADAKDSFKTSAGNFVNDAATGMIGKMTEVVKNLSGEAIKKIDAPKPQNSTP